MSVSILVTQDGRSVIIGFQKTQIYQRFAGSRQEVFILLNLKLRTINVSDIYLRD